MGCHAGLPQVLKNRRPDSYSSYISPVMRTPLSLVICPILLACSTSREVPPKAQVVEWTAKPVRIVNGPDGTPLLEVELRGKVEPGWHVYSLTQKAGGPTPMSVSVEGSTQYELAGSVDGPAAERAMDPNFGVETETYSGEPVFKLAVKVPSSALDSAAPIDLKVRSQACSDKLCLPARTTTLSVNPAIPKS